MPVAISACGGPVKRAKFVHSIDGFAVVYFCLLSIPEKKFRPACQKKTVSWVDHQNDVIVKIKKSFPQGFELMALEIKGRTPNAADHCTVQTEHEFVLLTIGLCPRYQIV